MSLPDPAVADANWLEPDDLYLTRGADVEIDRPIYQGDVFKDVPLPLLPQARPTTDQVEFQLERSTVMVVPHPCQCYHGDDLRPFLTVAPVTVVPNYGSFGTARTGAKDKFALPDLPIETQTGQWDAATCVADFGRLFSAPSNWLILPDRVACLSHQGLGLLAKRVLGFQLRYSTDLTTAMSYTAAEWNEAYLMQAWVRRYHTLDGYSAWMTTPKLISGVGLADELTKPYDVRAGAMDVLLELITGQYPTEPP